MRPPAGVNTFLFGFYKLSSSSSFPVLGLLRPVTGITELNPSIFSNFSTNYMTINLISSCNSNVDPKMRSFTKNERD
jgi:hypothetical protein